MPARALVADTRGQVGHRILGLAGHCRWCRDRRIVVLDRRRPRPIRIQFCVQRTCACRIDGKAIGDSKSMVLGKLFSSTKVDQVCPASRPTVAPIRVAQSKDTAAAVEVGLDVHPQLSALDRTAHVEEQPRLFGNEIRVGAFAPIRGDRAGVEGILGADGVEVTDDVQLDPSSRLEGKPPDLESVRRGGCRGSLRRVGSSAGSAGSAGSVFGAEGPPLSSTGELVCALAVLMADRKTAGSTSPRITLPRVASRCRRLSLLHKVGPLPLPSCCYRGVALRRLEKAQPSANEPTAFPALLNPLKNSALRHSTFGGARTEPSGISEALRNSRS